MPKKGIKECEKCGEKYPAHALKCPACAKQNYPNVSLAKLSQPQAALDRRYQNALQESEKNGTFDKVKEFEQHIQSYAKAVINLDVKILAGIIEGASYVNYHKLKGIYPSQSHEIDGRRRMIDSRFFGEFAEKIIFAALSTNGQGIRTYGNCTITLKEKMIDDRASLLEEDSFHFFEKLEQKGKKINYRNTYGFIATWDEKHKLAIAKLANTIENDDTPTDFDAKLLSVKNTKASAQFVEVHIFDDFGKGAIEDLTYCNETDLPKDKRRKATAEINFEIVKEYFNK